MKKTSKPKRTSPRGSNCLPITYDITVNGEFDGWATWCGTTPSRLRKATEQSLRTRQHEAFIEHESHKARGRQPNIYTLDLGLTPWVEVFYTIEPHAIVVRGYAWEISGEPLDDRGCGYFYSDNEWHLPDSTK